MNVLQEEIYSVFELWKKDFHNRDFYDLYVELCIGELPEQREYYSLYWESLKRNSNVKKE